MILDEEGKLKEEIEINEIATKLFQQGRPIHAEHVAKMKREYGDNFIDVGMGDAELDDVIIGIVLVCASDMFL